MTEWFDPIVKYVLVPLGGWMWFLHKRQGDHSTRLAVLESEQKHIDNALGDILKKLDSIEQYLRSK